MVNKLWYKDDFFSAERECILASRQYIQKYIDLYCPERFNVPEDITTDNLQEFLEIILKYYQLYLFNQNELMNLGESIEEYFHKAFIDEFPEQWYPEYPKTDRRELALHILSEIASGPSIHPEDVPVLIKCLNVSEEQIIAMYDYIDNYFNQFDRVKRFNNELSRFNFINDQRKEAIEQGQPIPIRPMGIEIDLYYKKVP
jgi:hypothetical protein